MKTVHVLYFAGLREQKGLSEEWIGIEADCTVGALFTRLFPAAAGETVAFAVNRVRTRAGHLLSPGDEVAFLPPLGGG